MKRTMATIFALTLAFSSSIAFANEQPYEQDGSEGGGGRPAVRTDSEPPSDHGPDNEALEENQPIWESYFDTFEDFLGNILNIVIAVPDHRQTM